MQLDFSAPSCVEASGSQRQRRATRHWKSRIREDEGGVEGVGKRTDEPSIEARVLLSGHTL